MARVVTFLRASRRDRSKPHPHDARIEKLEAELYRLRGERKRDLCAAMNKDPIKRAKAAKGRSRAWKDPTRRAAQIAALKAAWTPERRAAQAEKMRAIRADPVKRQEMLAAQVAAQRTPEHRQRVAEQSRAMWERRRRQAPRVDTIGDALAKAAG